MKNIRQLLENAAKASNVNLKDVESGLWDPSEDSEQAFMLALDLGIGMRHHQGWGEVFHPTMGDQAFDYNSEKYSSTRMAIVKIASDIWERNE